MPFTVTSQEGKHVLTLTGAVTIQDAQELAGVVAECVDDGNPVAVETEGLEVIDTCILQLLCSLRKSVAELSFENPSEAFLGALERRQLRRVLLGARDDL
jgi:anti-anti-sigma regulatory factor